MNIQSLSIVVPNKKCINDCAFCVSKMHTEDYKNMMDSNLPFYDLYEKDYIKRLEFARDNGCNTVMLTGNSEPQQNRGFLQRFGTMNNNLPRPFRWIEMQTTGVLIDEPYLRFLRNHVGVSTISISLSSLDDKQNSEYNGTPIGNEVDIEALCQMIKKYDFNLRLSLNLTNYYNYIKSFEDIESLFDQLYSRFGADQVTFRVLYTSKKLTKQDEWINQNNCDDEVIKRIIKYVKIKGNKLETLSYGAIKYSVKDVSVVIDNDCMAEDTEKIDVYKYLILRENCKLYSKWDDKASLIF